jgi:CRP-like cAMP-binding protein
MTYEYFPRETEIFKYGDPPDKFYVILKGEVSVKVPFAADTRQYRRTSEVLVESVFVEVGRLSDGQAFGELSVIKNKRRAATVDCLTDLHVATLSQQKYVEILGRIEEDRINEKVAILQ